MTTETKQATAIEMIPCKSSQIAAIGHDSETNTLAIQFPSKTGTGSIYHYQNFTANDFAAFSAAESKGAHFGKHIKPLAEKFPFVKIKPVQPSNPPEPAQNLYREIYEVWAGSEGIPMPRTAPEAYLLGLLEQMVDIAKTGMHMTEPAPQQLHPTHEANFAAQVVLGAAPSSDEVARMVERLRLYESVTMSVCLKAADMIERLAARVPDGCVVVPREATDEMLLAAESVKQYELSTPRLRWEAMIAAGEL